MFDVTVLLRTTLHPQESKDALIDELRELDVLPGWSVAMNDYSADSLSVEAYGRYEMTDEDEHRNASRDTQYMAAEGASLAVENVVHRWSVVSVHAVETDGY